MAVTRLYKSGAIYSGEHSIIYANLFQGKQACTRIRVVGKAMNKTAVFSGQMNQIVFSPYWNVPTSILRKEILPLSQKIATTCKNTTWNGWDVALDKGQSAKCIGSSEIIFPTLILFLCMIRHQKLI
jgi:hypothetical protein